MRDPILFLFRKKLTFVKKKEEEKNRKTLFVRLRKRPSSVDVVVVVVVYSVYQSCGDWRGRSIPSPNDSIDDTIDDPNIAKGLVGIF